MIFFLLPTPTPTVDDLVITTVQIEKVEFISSASSATPIVPLEESHFNSLESLIKTKEDKTSSTTVSFEGAVEGNSSQQNLNYSYYTADYDINSPVKAKKTVRVKARVNSIKKVSPKIFID